MSPTAIGAARIGDSRAHNRHHFACARRSNLEPHSAHRFRGLRPPCADGGAGEVVTLSGDLHTLLRYTESASGTIHAASHFQPQGISGVGETTGDKYQGTGVTQDEFNATVGVEETFVNNFRIIGQGPGNNVLVHSVFHITFNANGSITALVDRLSVDCR